LTLDSDSREIIRDAHYLMLPKEEFLDTVEVGKKLVEYCRNGLNLEAIASLYSNDIVSVEAGETGMFPQEVRGIDKVVEKNKAWYEANEIHHASAEGPFPHKDRFAVIFHYETTPKVGPLAGKRLEFEEVALFYVKDGKIVREEFFYEV
jgi:hypothetical protein